MSYKELVPLKKEHEKWCHLVNKHDCFCGAKEYNQCHSDFQPLIEYVEKLEAERNEIFKRLEEAVKLGVNQADEYDRFWNAMGCKSKDITVDEAIGKYKELEAKVEALNAEKAEECPEEGDEIWVKGKVKSYRKDTKKVWVEVQGHIGTRDDNWFEEGQYKMNTGKLYTERCPERNPAMDRPEHTCGLNFYCHGCYNIGYGQGIMDSKLSTSGEGEEAIAKTIYEHCNTHGYNLLDIEARKKLAHAIMEGMR